jgi:hypothetical protein
MPLDRDIFWVGRQWAVTGLGMQAVDQKQKSKFDIDISRLWDDNLLDGVSGERWFNIEDFNRALALARARYPEPPHRVRPAPKVEPVKPDAGREPRPKTPSCTAAPSAVKADRILQPPPGKATPAPPCAAVSPLKEGVSIQPSKSQPWSRLPRLVSEVEPAKLVVAKFAMRLEGGSAKFTPMWRIRIRR